MKKLISIMLAVFMLATTMSAFAAVTPMTEPGNATRMYFDNKTIIGDRAYTSGGVTGGTQSPTIAVAGDAITITHKTEARETAYYLFGGNRTTDAWEDDNLSFGYDLTFSGLSGFTANTTVFEHTPGSNNPKAKTEGGSKTSWHFYSDDSPSLSFKATADGKIILGSATMEQNQPYTIKIYADCKADTFVVTVTDVATGTVQEAITNGKIHPVFTDLGKMELNINAAANVGASVTVDNAFVNYNDPYSVLDIATPTNELAVADDGTVTFGARVSQGYENPTIYINDTQVESFSTVAGKKDYQVVATLPADTGFGDATIKLTATKDGSPVEVTKTVKITKEIVTTATAIPFSGTTPFGFQIAKGGTAVADAGANGGYAIEFPSTSTECTTYTFTTYRSGVYETSLEFKTATPASAYIQERLTYSTGGGTGLELSGTSSSNGVNYHFITNKTGTVGTESIVANEWNKVSTRIDFTNGTWAYYLNGKLAQSGAINKFETKNSFTALRYMFAGVTVRNLKINKVSGAPTVTGATVVNADGSTLDATSAAASSLNLDKISFTTSDAITPGAGGAKIVAADGTTVPATVTVDGTTITADYTGSSILPTGTYKLVIGSDATVGGVVLGASVVKEFALTSASAIFTPAANAVVTGTTNLSIYGENADKVEFYINDALVTAFTEATADGIYTYAYTPATDGTKQFDAYVYSGTEVTVVSNTFEVTAFSKTTPITTEVDSANFSKNKMYPIYAAYGGYGYTYETGRAVIEGTITLHAQDNWYFNIGASATADWSTGNGWGTLDDMIGYTTDSYRLFNANGTIYNTQKTYALDNPMKVKVVMDMNADRYEFYVDGELMGTKGADTTKTRNIANIAYFFNRVRFTPAGGVASTATLTDFTIYQEYAAPKVTGVAYGTTGATKLAGSYVVPETADTVTLTLDKAYTALDEADLTVKLGGTTVTPTVAYDAEARTITLSGLELVKGTKLEVTIAETPTIAIPYADMTNKQITTRNVQAGSEVEAVITVADSNCLAILPMKAATVGTNNFASYKYLNAGTEIDARLILANYITVGGMPSLNEAAIEAATLEAGGSGIIGASMTEAFKAFLWNIETLEPLVDAAE